MSKIELLQEIKNVTIKLSGDNLGQIQRTELMICLIELYKSALNERGLK